MACKCNAGTTVVDSRPHELGIRRRRKCDRCGERWSTIEVEVSGTCTLDDGANGHPLVRRFFDLVNELKVPLLAVSRGAGLARDTLYDWRLRKSPSVPNLDAALNVIGYELTIRKKDGQCIRAA